MQILVFCEGNTEFNYIQELNRFLREMDISTCQFFAENLNGGVSHKKYSSQIQNKIKKKNGNFSNFFIWLDYDIFKRNNISDAVVKQKLSELKVPKKLKLAEKIKPILNYMNAEDFLILHCCKNKIVDWLNICNRRKHFKKPMHGKDYEPLFKNIITDYKKSEIPKDICFSKEVFKKCIANIENKSMPFKSDAIEILRLVLDVLKKHE